jgi:hypothetical protein
MTEEQMAEVIHDAIDALPHAERLYPDLYAHKVAAAILAAQTERNDE